MSDQAARVVSPGGNPLQAPAQMQGNEHVVLKPVGMGTDATHPSITHPTGTGHHGPLHDPHAAVESDPARYGMHDGTMYAQGATGETMSHPAHEHLSVGQRIKEALPGTKEHRAKKEVEDNMAVYS